MDTPIDDQAKLTTKKEKQLSDFIVKHTFFFHFPISIIIYYLMKNVSV